jgi:hypothetical protein
MSDSYYPFIMGIDQYGFHYDNLGPYPRKALMDKLGYQHVEKMYVDTIDGKTKHIGYVIGGRWITLYWIKRWEKEE